MSHRGRPKGRPRCDAGIFIGVSLIVGSLEFVGPFEERGWKLAGAIVPVAYIAWSLWLIVAGLVLLVA